MLKDNASQLFQGFSKLSRTERLQRLVEMGALTSEDVQFLDTSSGLSPNFAEKFIENVIGYYHMPLGVAMNFRVDGKDWVIPMAVEETSIIAAASKTAKWIHSLGGTIATEVDGECIIGQIQFATISDVDSFTRLIEENCESLVADCNERVACGLVARGGGVKELRVRKLRRPDGQTMAVVHVLADPCDAMGANIMNQVCEYLKVPLAELTGEQASMCILSNLVDTKLTRCRVRIPNFDPDLGKRIEEASLFALVDPYRATTNNKGVLNGIDPILLATGNDWRAVEAAVHAYAARDGQYRSITHWHFEDGILHGLFEAPVIVGTVGGVTRLHPTAQMNLRIMGVNTANELSRIVSAVGLVQNLGAIRALTTVGIIEGHMKLHIANLTLGAGACDSEVPVVQQKLEEILRKQKRISLRDAKAVLDQLRQKPAPAEMTPPPSFS